MRLIKEMVEQMFGKESNPTKWQHFPYELCGETFWMRRDTLTMEQKKEVAAVMDSLAKKYAMS